MAVAEFDWSQVHDFDPSEAGRTRSEVNRLITQRIMTTGVLANKDQPETPDHLR